MVALLTLCLFLILLLVAFTAGIDRGRREVVREAYESVKPVKLENEMLRELVRHMHRIIAESCAVQYPYPPEPVSYLSQLEVEKRMRELGIEVSK